MVYPTCGPGVDLRPWCAPLLQALLVISSSILVPKRIERVGAVIEDPTG